MVTKNSARVGAAAFALGLSLAGPSGVAAADVAEGDSPAVSATTAGTQRDGATVHPRRATATAGARGARTARSAPPAAAADGAQEPSTSRARVRVDRGLGPKPRAGGARSAPAVLSPATAAPVHTALLGDSPAQRVPAVVAVVVTNSVPAAAASGTGACGDCGAFAATPAVPPTGMAVTAVIRAAQFLDGIGDRLSALPASPVSNFLSGALLLLRRNLFPTVPTIPVASVANVIVEEASPQAVFTVTLGRAYTSTVTVGYATVSSPTRPGAELGDQATYAAAGADYHAASGILTFAPGQTTQQVIVDCLDDQAVEVSESFGLEILAVITPRNSAAAAPVASSATQVGDDQVTSVVLASGTATIVDDDRVKIDVNPNFAYGDALLASIFSDLAYNHRDPADFNSRVQATGWEGIGVSRASLGANSYSPAAGGYGIRDGLSLQSYAFAGKRTAADGTVQFVVAFEGSNSPTSEPADWIANAGQYGWSRYYASLEPLMAEVVGQMLQVQHEQKNTQLILTGHSLGGAVAMMAFGDLLAPQGNLWPDTADVLSAGHRVLDTVGGWSSETRTALLAATQVYTFGAPSILIEPNKLGTAETAAFVAAAPLSGPVAALALLARTIGALSVDDKKLPDFTGIAGINFGTRVFQFEHANTSWLYPGDIVAQIGSRDPGTVLHVNLVDSVHEAYTSLLTRFVPGGTHPMSGYRESVTRLVTNSTLLKSPNELSASTPQLSPTSPGNGSDTRNDFFVNTSDDGKNGNDLFVFSKAGSYSAGGGGGTDTYSVSSYDVVLVIDGAEQSGRDSLVFDLAGTPGAQYYNTGTGLRNDIAIFSVTGSGGQSSSVKITNWDQWQVSDVFQVIKPADGRWSLDAWTDINGGPVVVVSPADEIPLSVV